MYIYVMMVSYLEIDWTPAGCFVFLHMGSVGNGKIEIYLVT